MERGLMLYCMTVKSTAINTIFAFITAQNCELNAQGNLWLEILEFWAVLLYCLYTVSYSDGEAMAQISVTKKRSFLHKKDLFYYTFGLHLQSKCTPIALQKDNFCKVKKPQMTSWNVFVAPKNYKTRI